MQRITLILGLVTVMVVLIVALAAPAMAKDNNRKENRQENRFNNNHDNWFDNDRDNVVIRYVADRDLDSDDFDSFYPYWGSYDDCGFDWDGPVTPADCWD